MSEAPQKPKVNWYLSPWAHVLFLFIWAFVCTQISLNADLDKMELGALANLIVPSVMAVLVLVFYLAVYFVYRPLSWVVTLLGAACMLYFSLNLAT